MVDTITSGRVVPMDTTVAPMSSSGRWNRRASADAPSTNQSPPLIRQSNPKRNRMPGIIISFLPISLRAQIAPHHITKAILYMIPNFRVEYNALPEDILNPTI